jgi:hypothetical protein
VNDETASPSQTKSPVATCKNLRGGRITRWKEGRGKRQEIKRYISLVLSISPPKSILGGGNCLPLAL